MLTIYICATVSTIIFWSTSMKSVLVLFALIVALIISSATSRSQGLSPDGQFGVGVVAGQMYGGYLAYAITPAVHVGTGLGLRVESNNNQFYFAPYGKFIFAGTDELKPFIVGQFMILTDATINNQGEKTASTSLAFAPGAEYFITQHFGIWGAITVLNLGFTPSGTQFGLLLGNVGVEWFFH